MKVFKQREIEVTEIKHGSDPVDSFVECAYWVDTGENLTDDELDELNMQRSDIAQDDWMENQIDKADRMRDEERDNERF